MAFGLTALVAAPANISGAGATFPFPIYAKWAGAYKTATDVGLNYQSIGPGGGIKQIEAKTVDFGASDKPLEPAELDKFGLMQFPMIMGGVVPVVNVPGIGAGELKLDRPPRLRTAPALPRQGQAPAETVRAGDDGRTGERDRKAQSPGRVQRGARLRQRPRRAVQRVEVEQSRVDAGRIVSRRADHQAGSVQRDAAAEVVTRGRG